LCLNHTDIQLTSGNPFTMSSFPTPEVVIINTKELLISFLDSVYGKYKTQPAAKPSIYIDLEGINLSRTGTISIIQMLVEPTNKTYFIDVHILGNLAFMTKNDAGFSLKTVLEDPNVLKGVFDVRNDSDALFSLFSVRVAGMIDIQVLELASRRGRDRKYVSGLAKCIEYDSGLSYQNKIRFKQTKDYGSKLFGPEKGGSYEVWNERPLKKELCDYAAQDVAILPGLWEVYSSKLTTLKLKEFYTKKVGTVTKQRVEESQSAGYKPHGQHKALGWNTFQLLKEAQDFERSMGRPLPSQIDVIFG
jgi:exonuclease 3'-5' domain-containing protein 1